MANIVRIKKNKNFVVMDKTALNDKRLSWKAKGIIAFMLSKPDDWTFYLDEISSNATDGMSSFRSGFNELKKLGYIKRIRTQDKNGKFTWETQVFEIPLTENPQVDNPYMEKPHVENPRMENRNLLNNELTKNELTKNDSTKNKEDIYTLYEHWNNQKIINHRRMTEKMKRSSRARLKDYTLEELKKAIDNYKEILESEKYYWTHKWTYEDFMKPSNVIKFLDEAEPFSNYLKGGFDNAINSRGYGGHSKQGKSYEDVQRELKQAESAWTN